MVIRSIKVLLVFALLGFLSTSLHAKDAPSLLIAPFSKQEATAKQQAWAKHLGKKVIETNSIGMKMALIPAGEFQMGSPKSEKGRGRDELQHKVRLTQPFYLSTTEVTQKQWKAMMGTTPWKGEDYVTENDTHPAMYVSWNDAQEFIKKLNKKEGVRYRLPSEAEWEYACRAGTTTPFHFGNSSNGSKSNVYGEIPYGTTTKGKFLKTTSRVSSYDSNSFGLYDMHGNVWEWCSDWYYDDYYKKFANKVAVDPEGVAAGSSHVLRGGSWGINPSPGRSSSRNRGAPAYRTGGVGFRVVRIVE